MSVRKLVTTRASWQTRYRESGSAITVVLWKDYRQVKVCSELISRMRTAVFYKPVVLVSHA